MEVLDEHEGVTAGASPAVATLVESAVVAKCEFAELVDDVVANEPVWVVV